jgi:hypothetical protein
MHAISPLASRENEHWAGLTTHYLFAPIRVGVGETDSDPA